VRDPDGVIRHVARQSPPGSRDRLGNAAEAALMEALADRTSSGGGIVTGSTLVTALLETHLARLKDAKRAPRTLDTYRLRVGYWKSVAAGLRAAECTPGTLDQVLGQVRHAHGETTAKQLRTLLAAALDIAVIEGVLPVNPATAAKSDPKPRGDGQPKGATPLDPDALPVVIAALTASEPCRDKDLVDPILMHLATGLRVSEILGLLWADFDPEKQIVAVTGRVVRATGQGLLRTPVADSSKGTAPTLALPEFAVALLLTRAAEPRPGGMDLIFPSSTGTLRDPNNFAKQWRGVRDDLGDELKTTTGHSFRKTMASLVTENGMSAQVAADVLGHRDVRTTLSRYIRRGRVHPQVAALLDKAVRGDEEPDSQTR
jgi:integrase